MKQLILLALVLIGLCLSVFFVHKLDQDRIEQMRMDTGDVLNIAKQEGIVDDDTGSATAIAQLETSEVRENTLCYFYYKAYLAHQLLQKAAGTENHTLNRKVWPLFERAAVPFIDGAKAPGDTGASCGGKDRIDRMQAASGYLKILQAAIPQSETLQNRKDSLRRSLLYELSIRQPFPQDRLLSLANQFDLRESDLREAGLSQAEARQVYCRRPNSQCK